MSSMTFQRGTGPLQLSINGGEWWITYPNKMIEYTEDQRAYARYNGVILPEESGVLAVQINLEQLLHTLTLDELRLLLGYLAHITEHGSTHVGSLMNSMYQAHTARNWEVLRTLNQELDECLASIKCAGDTGKEIFASFDENSES